MSVHRRALVIGLAAALAVGTLAAAPAEPICAVEEPTETGWGSNRPSAPSADERVVQLTSGSGDVYVGFSVGQRQGRDAAVVDANSLQVSSDAGCTWTTAWAFDRDLDPTGEIEPATSRFAAVATSDREQGREQVVALVYDLDGGMSARVRTLVSQDGGETFRVGGQGLPDAVLFPYVAADGCGPGRGCLLQIAPSDPDRVYAIVAGLEQGLFRSRDGGLSFNQVGGGIIGEGGDAWPIDLSISRTNPDRLWAVEFNGLVSSTDGGGSWAHHDVAAAMDGAEVGQTVAVASVTGEVFDEVVVVLVDRDGQEWTVHSDDDGLTWRGARTRLGTGLTDLAGGRRPGAFHAATADRGAFVLDVTELSWNRIGGASLGPLADIHPLAESDTVWFRGPTNLPVTGDVQFTPPPAFDLAFDVGPFDPLNPTGRLPGRLAVPDDVIRLEVGQEATRAITLHLPRTPTPLDVFFLFDESGSMDAEMEALANAMADIAQGLIKRRVDLAVGLGGYSGGWRYRLHRDIGPPDAEFQQALGQLGQGGGSAIEPAYTALHQVATGTGLPDSRAGKGPRPGWNAHWRHGAIRLVVNLTDERLQVEESPTVEETLDALVEHAIKVMGLVSTDFGGDFGGADAPTSLDGGIRESDPQFGAVARMARITGALAPASGADCGADGEVDIEAGEPLACYLNPLTVLPQDADVVDLLPDFADVIVEILESITEEHRITFHATDTDVVRSIKPLVDTVVDIRDPQTIPAIVTLACPRSRYSTVVRPLITAVASSRMLAAEHLVVACGPITPAALAAARPAMAAAAPPPAPLPPPAPATAAAQAASGAQAAAGASAPAGATSVIPQVGVAAVTQQQQQTQVATIDRLPPREGDEPGLAFEFRARRDRSDAPVTLAMAGAMVLGAGALARRRRSAEVHQRIRVRGRG